MVTNTHVHLILPTTIVTTPHTPNRNHCRRRTHACTPVSSSFTHSTARTHTRTHSTIHTLRVEAVMLTPLPTPHDIPPSHQSKFLFFLKKKKENGFAPRPLDLHKAAGRGCAISWILGCRRRESRVEKRKGREMEWWQLLTMAFFPGDFDFRQRERGGRVSE